MKSTSKLLKLSAMVGLSLTLSNSLMAAPNIYVCGTETVTLIYDGGHTLNMGDKVIWAKSGGGAEELTYNGTLESVNFPVPLADIATVGAHTYTAHVESADPANCSGDASDPVEIYRLPELALTLNADLAAYCAGNSGTDADDAGQSVITASTTNTDIPTEVLLAYAWSATNDGTAVDPLSSIGTVEANNTTAQALTNNFTLTTTTSGEYAFNATVQYAATDVNGITIKGGCSTTSTTPTIVTVTPKPGKPKISVE